MADVPVILPRSPSPLVQKAGDLLRRRLGERGVQRTRVGAVRLGLTPGPGPEGYRIAVTPDGIAIDGADERGLLYGVGRFLRHAEVDGESLAGCAWQGQSAPAKPIRGMYFATHFHNVYHEAPLAEIVRYLEDLALWGCNALSVWFDLHHYRGLDEPAARAMVARLRAILQAAAAVGMRGGLTSLANEGFAATPDALKADWTAGHDGYFRAPGGHYHCEVCPSQPGGMDEILRTRRQVLEAFKDLDIGYAWLWPYDQGGCTCRACAPWGTNGFLRTCEALLPLWREYFPRAQVILSTWYFDRFVAGEWRGLDERLARQPLPGVDLLMIDDFGGFPEYPRQHGIPGGLPVVSFPEISMEGNGPWGGFGAHPRPAHWEHYWRQVKDLMQGSFPYSEGLHEDLNKVLILQLEWSPDRAADDIVREYAASYFGAAAAEPVCRVARQIEADGGLHTVYGPDGPSFQSGPLTGAEASLAELERLVPRLSNPVRHSWRWRLLWLRATIAAEIRRGGGRLTPALDQAFEELTTIYHAEHAERAVRPPSRRACR